ncbi:MAG: hypothetical protein Q8Q12_02150 [bacterium]|nr:hypothetical protein [bacterium]
MTRICILTVLVSGALCAMGGSCHSLSGPGTYHFKYNADTGETVMRWGEDGSLPGQNWSGHGACITPTSPHTFLTSDWFCCRLQEWTLDGRWIRTLQNHLRSDAQSFKCMNESGGDQTLHQNVYLQAGAHTLQFLAFTNGEKVTQYDVEPYAQGTQMNGTDYDDYVLTTVKTTPEQSMWACRVSGEFSVGTSGFYDIGARVKPGKTVYIASLTCFRN